MRTARLMFVAFAVSAVAACGSTEPPARVPGTITVLRGNNQRAVIQEAIADSMKFRVLDTEGAPMANKRVDFTVTSGTLAAPFAITNGAGDVVVPTWTLGSTEGAVTLTATVEGAPAVTSTITATAVLSFYDIRIEYVNSGTASQRAVFEEAVRKWRGIISSELTDVPITIDPANPDLDCGTAPAFSDTVDDLLIFVDLVAIDGPNGVLGSAGPCFIRSSNQITIAGIMRFDTADLPALELRGQLDEVVTHEMGHVLGIGSLWPQKNLRDNTNTADPIFTGAQAQSAFLAPAFGGAGCGCRAVPIESSGGSGTALVHWRESTLTRELMTGFLQQTGSNPLSIVTIASLQDYGYQVRTARAEAYSIASTAIMSEFTQTQPDLKIVEGDIKGMIKEVDSNGHVVRMHRRVSSKQ